MSGQPLTELVNRSKELFDGTDLLIAGDVADPQLLSLCKNCHLADVITDNYVTFRQMAAMLAQTATDSIMQTVTYKHLSVHFGVPDELKDKLKSYNCALLFLQKNKNSTVKLLSFLSAKLPPKSRVYLAGANSGGGKSAYRLLEAAGTPFKVDSARKCTLFGLRVEHDFPAAAAISQITTADKISLYQSPDVFSCGKLDEGTALLLTELSQVKSGKSALDLGCGCGVVGISLKKAGFESVTCVDVSASALLLTAKNAQLNKVDLTVKPSDMLSNTATYDLIAVNPPFHQGLAQDRSPTLEMLSTVPQHLNPQGVLYLVGNNFLKYERVLKTVFSSVEIVRANSRFSVIKATM